VSAEDTYAAPVSFKVGGETVEFPRLLLPDYARLEAAERTRRTAVVDAIIAAAGMEGVARATFAAQQLAAPVPMRAVEEFVDTAPGARAALRLSLKRAGKSEKEADAVIDRLTYQDAALYAGVVAGFLTLRPAPAPRPPEASADPLPQAPPADPQT